MMQIVRINPARVQAVEIKPYGKSGQIPSSQRYRLLTLHAKTSAKLKLSDMIACDTGASEWNRTTDLGLMSPTL